MRIAVCLSVFEMLMVLYMYYLLVDYIPDSKFYKVEAILRYEVQVLVKLGLLLLLLLLFPFFPSPFLSSMYFFFHLLLISGRIRPWRVQQVSSVRTDKPRPFLFMVTIGITF